MVDRLEAIIDLTGLRPSLSLASQKALQKSLDKTLSLLVLGVDLSDIVNASGEARTRIADVLSEALTFTELKKVSKRWDPARTVDKSLSHSDLIEQVRELVEGVREPFEPVAKLALSRAHTLDEVSKANASDGIRRLMTDQQVLSLLKKWDKYSAVATSGNNSEMRKHLVELLYERKDIIKPPPKQKKSSSAKKAAA